MARLGYERYFAQGGDWGSMITTSIGIQDTEHCAGLHTNMPVVFPPPEMLAEATEQERDALAGQKYYQDWDSGYSKQQSTRPQTLGYGLVDSPGPARPPGSWRSSTSGRTATATRRTSSRATSCSTTSCSTG